MSFCRNTPQQIKLNDQLLLLTEREMKRLKRSWAETFSAQVFPLINEDRFSVLYSDKQASRPNNPVNVVFGLLMLKEFFAQTDEEATESLMFDIRYQYALHTSSREEQPISRNSLSNFRTAVYLYDEEHGTDLIKEEIESHAKQFSKILNISGKIKRMDSLMVSSSCKRLSRLEIIYSCVARLIAEIDKNYAGFLSEPMKVYLESGHKNDTIYRSQEKDVDSKMKKLTDDAVTLFFQCKNHPVANTDEYKLLCRMLGDQTVAEGDRFTLKAGKDIASTSLQNPTDPDATSRRKGNKFYTGYTGNFLENFDGKNAIIEQFSLEANIHSDQSFSKEIIESIGGGESEISVLVDGAYYSEEINNLAVEQNIKIVPTALVGKISEKMTGTANISIDEMTSLLRHCANLKTPIANTFRDNTYIARFSKEQCTNCPHKEHCPVIEQKKSNLLKVSVEKLTRAKFIVAMRTTEYLSTANKRAGVEGVPSVLRRRHHIDTLPVRGLVRSKLWYGLKIGAINMKRLMKGVEKGGIISFLSQIFSKYSPFHSDMYFSMNIFLVAT